MGRREDDQRYYSTGEGDNSGNTDTKEEQGRELWVRMVNHSVLVSVGVSVGVHVW